MVPVPTIAHVCNVGTRGVSDTVATTTISPPSHDKNGRELLRGAVGWNAVPYIPGKRPAFRRRVHRATFRGCFEGCGMRRVFDLNHPIT